MKKQSVPTKEELEKLAKVAGISYAYFDAYNEWQPHEDMNQIAMVIKGLTDVQFTTFTRKLTEKICPNEPVTFDNLIEELTIPIVGVRKIITVDPSISCEKLLEVLVCK